MTKYYSTEFVFPKYIVLDDDDYYLTDSLKEATDLTEDQFREAKNVLYDRDIIDDVKQFIPVINQFEPREQTRIHLNDNEDTVWVLLSDGTHRPLMDLLRTDILNDKNKQAINDELVDIINDRDFMQFMEQYNNESSLGDDI